jgi:hypothetical protein
LLNFELPNRSDSVEWGRHGFEEAKLWPLLPTGIMTAGEPINRPTLEMREAQKHGLALASDEELIFLLEVRRKPEDEWSLTEEPRYSQICERLSKK